MTTATADNFIKRNALNLIYLAGLLFIGAGLLATSQTSPNMADISGLVGLICMTGALLDMLKNIKEDKRVSTESSTLWLINASLYAMIFTWCAYHTALLFSAPI